MPPDPAPHITARLSEIGLCEAAGMGVVPLSWQTIDAWARLTGVQLAPWEARLIRKLSSDYVSMTRKAESENCPPPWRSPVTDEQRNAEVEQLKRVLG